MSCASLITISSDPVAPDTFGMLPAREESHRRLPSVRTCSLPAFHLLCVSRFALAAASNRSSHASVCGLYVGCTTTIVTGTTAYRSARYSSRSNSSSSFPLCRGNISTIVSPRCPWIDSIDSTIGSV